MIELFALLSAQGFAPTYHGRFTNGRIEGWMEARPLEPEEMGQVGSVHCSIECGWIEGANTVSHMCARFSQMQTSPVNFLDMIGKELGIMHVMDIAGDRSPVLWEVSRAPPRVSSR